jgi:hypothetical protein
MAKCGKSNTYRRKLLAITGRIDVAEAIYIGKSEEMTEKHIKRSLVLNDMISGDENQSNRNK